MVPNRASRLVLILAAASCAAASLLLPGGASACTTAVVSGKATADGRPLLWKNRDADDLHNQAVYRDDGKYAYVGLVNGADQLGLQIWSGVNAAGFAIMNSASYNLTEPGQDTNTVAEGLLMKLALQTCATVDDFERLLATSDAAGRDVSANFGVIDARGGAAFFETGRHAHKRFDAADPRVAPDGMVVRSNYSDGGDDKEGSGFLRRARAEELLGRLAAEKKLSAETLLADVARDLGNAALNVDPRRPGGAPGAWVQTIDTINRDITSNASVFVGPRPGEDPRQATAWVILGQPLTGAAVPLWPAAGAVPPQLAAGAARAPLGETFDKIKELYYPRRRGELKRYISVAAVAGPRSPAPALLAAEARNFRRVAEAEKTWGAGAPAAAELLELETEIAERTLDDARAALAAAR